MASMTSLWASCASVTLLLILTQVPAGYGNAEADALIAQKYSLSDPDNVLRSWDPTLVDPCTWIHITCNEENQKLGECTPIWAFST
ncbi:hypothetical protein RCOM_1022630 [Ricinus communis]|uniref:Leucine-rich repeat-containing N-terminal plant-type domain-containing protein n=1 Tax=Ricinus communis TaxID=3988 RepID=B9RWN3_RICCO|nr:hypothetical protein RCOM_1022630 [Ricinus communis]